MPPPVPAAGSTPPPAIKLQIVNLQNGTGTLLFVSFLTQLWAAVFGDDGVAPTIASLQVQIDTIFAMHGDGTLSLTGELTVTKTGGVSFGYFATGTSAANLTGNLAVARLNNGTGATAFTFWRGDGAWAHPKAPTQTAILAGAGNYNPPAGCIQLRIRLQAAGAGGCGSSTAGAGDGGAGTAGGNTVFGAFTANGGQPGTRFQQGNGGTGGAGGGYRRQPGGSGGEGFSTGAATVVEAIGGMGGAAMLGCPVFYGNAPAANSGCGGPGGSQGAGAGVEAGGGGGGGEGAEIVIDNPVGPYAYSVGGAGAAGAAGTGGTAGRVGASGALFIEEIY